MSENKKQQGQAQNRQEKSKRRWLKLAKAERQHAQDNMNLRKKEGNDYSVQVYQVRIKALDHYIKFLQNQEA